ncbi:MAG TPA: glycosyltransferase, partial [Candidatus Hydrogenedentes bacterium]|nr:glycosyltransferase [Candidatus Hydrogenedentota bacterium]
MKKENKPALSVFVLFYNHEKFVTTCLESVFSEDLSGVEVIISDDCSADSTFGICKKYISTKKSNASRVLLNRNRKNLGINAHVNKLVDLANADVFLPLAGDDWFARDKIQRIKKEIQKSKYSMYVSDCYIANSEGIVIKEYNFNDK